MKNMNYSSGSDTNLSRDEWIAVVIGLIIIAFIFGGFGLFGSLFSTGADENVIVDSMQEDENVIDERGVEVIVLEEGEGVQAQDGDLMTVNYRGELQATRQEFDNSYDRGVPFEFVLGAGQVIRGWEQGLLGAKVGEKRQLIIPAELGYGTSGVPGVIPPSSTLIFEVEVLDIQQPSN